jgi:hypothetical protein
VLFTFNHYDCWLCTCSYHCCCKVVFGLIKKIPLPNFIFLDDFFLLKYILWDSTPFFFL